MKKYWIAEAGEPVWEACRFTDGSAVSVDLVVLQGSFYDTAPDTWDDLPLRVEPVGLRLFHLYRMEDETGNTGTGIVAEGVQFSNGSAVLRWLSETPSFVVYSGTDGVAAAERVHGHGGRTQVIFRDDPDSE